jgi:hypothetical protein
MGGLVAHHVFRRLDLHGNRDASSDVVVDRESSVLVAIGHTCTASLELDCTVQPLRDERAAACALTLESELDVQAMPVAARRWCAQARQRSPQRAPFARAGNSVQIEAFVRPTAWSHRIGTFALDPRGMQPKAVAHPRARRTWRGRRASTERTSTRLVPMVRSSPGLKTASPLRNKLPGPFDPRVGANCGATIGNVAEYARTDPMKRWMLRSSGPPPVVKPDLGLRTKWLRALDRLKRAKTPLARWKVALEIVSSSPPLCFAATMRPGRFIAEHMKASPREARRMLLVARHAEAVDLKKATPAKLEAAIELLAARRRLPEGRVAFRRFQVDVVRRGGALRLPLLEASVAELRLAARMARRTREPAARKQPTLVRALLPMLRGRLRAVRVHQAGASLSLSGIPADAEALAGLGKALISVAAPRSD